MNNKFLLTLIIIAVSGLSWGGAKALDYVNTKMLLSSQNSLHENNERLRATNTTLEAQIVANEAQLVANEKLIDSNSALWREIAGGLGK